MSDISQIQLSNGDIYNVKDAEAQKILDILLGIQDEENGED